MKTKIYITAILTIMTVMFSLTLQASDYYFEDENLINDIPFDTETIYNQMLTETKTSFFQFDDEGLIDDIPFDTKKIVTNYKYHKALNRKFNFTDEGLIDDIPFDTKKIVVEYQYRKAIQKKYSFKDEKLVDDIPFDTYKIAQRQKANHKPYPFIVTFSEKYMY
ncbi:MAG TPA: hypothetical protein ENH02_05885 [Bacteroidetes bacterium]|nr:hypothetical protein [Bacteroidota bacterium]